LDRFVRHAVGGWDESISSERPRHQEHARPENRRAGDPRIKASPDEVARRLEGNWRKELLFILKQEYDSYQGRQRQIQECDRESHEHFQNLPQKADRKFYEQKYPEQQIQMLTKKAAGLGLQLINPRRFRSGFLESVPRPDSSGRLSSLLRLPV